MTNNGLTEARRALQQAESALLESSDRAAALAAHDLALRAYVRALAGVLS